MHPAIMRNVSAGGVVKSLKRGRVAVSLVFFGLTALLFLDFSGFVPPAFMTGVTYLQFLPSLLKFVNLACLAATGFIAVLLLTLLFGRVYCSTICPLGTLQDFFTYLSRKIRRKQYQRRQSRHDRVRYGLLALTIVACAAGSTMAATLLDPFSNTGRILASLGRPLVIGANNVLAFALQLLHIYTVNPVEQYRPGWFAIAGALLILGVVAGFSFTRGRLWCNTICPVGAVLGLMSRFALFKVAINQGDCKGCGLCERVCKAGCIDRKAMTVDFDRCVGCFNCFEICPRDDMFFRTPWHKRRERGGENVSRGRRRFVQQAAGSLMVLGVVPGVGKKIVSTKATTVPTGSALAVSPPGSRGLDHFTATCTACHLCVSVCPARVLQPSFLEYGIGGIFQPRMAYDVAYCNYDCTLCLQVCPSGAILPMEQEEKKLTQLGVAKFVKDNCIVNTEGTDCGACSEHCPTKAVSMVPFKNKLVIPEVRSDFCVGCGACEHACPTRPFRAIFVESNRVHARAKKPEQKPVIQPTAPAEDFPF
jgi:polyferredoxin